ncbi:MAG: hypothetical protein RL398_3509, partial [Planctomycetota bacterium]
MATPQGSVFVGFDVGTQGTKAVAIDSATGRVVARSARAYDLIGGLPPGHQEQHPQTWLDAVAATARELWQSVDPARVAGLAVSGQQHGAVVLDACGEVVRPTKLWCDTATADEARELSRRLGRSVPTGFTASKLLWLARHEPERWAAVRHVLLPHDYVNYVLTGELAMEWGDASGTGWFDPRRREFDAEAMSAIDARLPNLVPPLRPAGGLHGRLSARGAALLGLPLGVAVAQGGGDNMMSAIGSGAVAPGVVVVSLGTSGTIFTRSGVPVIDPQGLIAPFCSSDGGWLPLLCVMNATGPLVEIQELTGLSHEALTAAAEAVSIGCDGAQFIPFLVGERVPDLPEATGALLGLRPGTLRPGVLYRAALEGVGANLALGLQRLRGLGIDPSEVRLVGGAAKNALWRQILADLFGVPVRPLLEAESGALGAALQAQWATARQSDAAASLAAIAEPY